MFCDGRREKSMQSECFRELGLSPLVMRGIGELESTELFPTHVHAISSLPEGKNAIESSNGDR
jgi:hypothetical protein